MNCMVECEYSQHLILCGTVEDMNSDKRVTKMPLCRCLFLCFAEMENENYFCFIPLSPLLGSAGIVYSYNIFKFALSFQD
jgi:hypothetical protein